jgi:hypothetical protein
MWTRLAVLAVGLVAGPGVAAAADLAKVDRTIRREPAYKSREPRYCLLVFGPAADYRVWLVLDGDALYVDRNGNGDLTEAGEATGPEAADTDPCSFRPVRVRRPDGKAEEELSFALYGWFDYRAGRATDRVCPSVSVTWGGRVYGSWGDETGPCVWGTRPADAPVLHVGGPLQMGFEVPAESALEWKGSYQIEVNAAVGTKGLGRGSFVHLSYAKDAIPKDIYPTVVIEFPGKTPGPPERVRTVLKQRC